MLTIIENGVTRDDVALAALGDTRVLAHGVEGDDFVVGEFLDVHGCSFHLVDEHFDAVECGRLGVEHATERLETEIGVDLGEKHLAASLVAADGERTLATELVLLGDLDGFYFAPPSG